MFFFSVIGAKQMRYDDDDDDDDDPSMSFYRNNETGREDGVRDCRASCATCSISISQTLHAHCCKRKFK